MLKRIITALVAICVLIPILMLSNTVVFPAAVAIVTVVCIFEILKCLGLAKKLSASLPLYGFALLLPFMLRYCNNKVYVAMICFIFSVAYCIYIYAHIIWSHGKFSFADGSCVLVLMLYIVGAMNSIVYIRDFGAGGKYLYILIFIGAWITDIFAYFTGRFLGKHKLIEDVSPKKTIEGSIGGIVFCAISFTVFGIIVNSFFGQSANLIFLAISGVIISVISQIGDLIMSVIKRHYGIKDYGKIFPGHGGMLDRFDSVLAVSIGLAAVCMFSSVVGINLI